MMQESIVLKGSKRGLQIKLKQSMDYSTILKEIENKIDSAQNFFSHGGTIEISGDRLIDSDRVLLQNYLEEKYHLKVLWQSKDISPLSKVLELPDCNTIDITEEGPTQFIRATIRSGQRFEYRGNAVVLGDVNPGGEIKCGGNIIILGSLRGMAHAGCNGNNKAIIAAHKLRPTQLRIGDLITRPPDKDSSQSTQEIAYIKNGIIVIETIG